MTAMPNSPGRFRAAVGTGWVLLGFAAFVYARMKGIPAWGAVPVAAAFLVEFLFYLLPAFFPERLRNPFLLTASSIAPWLIYSIPTGQFQLNGFLLLLAIAATVSFWYRILPESSATDLLFLALPAAVVISKILDQIYLSPVSELHRSELSTLGHLMLIRTSAIAILAIRGRAEVEYRFLPKCPEWITGLRWFLVMTPACGLALWSLGIAQLRPRPHAVPLAFAEFAGILWIVALSEEFFFRGLLQQWLERWTANPVAALLITSVLFGVAHLGFHGKFPNWRFSIVAAIFGLCCGLAWRESRSVPASMVAHALAATVYRVFFL